MVDICKIMQKNKSCDFCKNYEKRIFRIMGDTGGVVYYFFGIIGFRHDKNRSTRAEVVGDD